MVCVAKRLSKDENRVGLHKGTQSPTKTIEKPESGAVQVMLVSTDNAVKLEPHRRRIEAMGYRTYVVSISGMKKLRVGPFDSLQKTRQVLQTMRLNGYPDAFLLREE